MIYQTINKKNLLVEHKAEMISEDIEEFCNYLEKSFVTKDEKLILIANYEKSLLLKYTTNNQNNNFGKCWIKIIKSMFTEDMRKRGYFI